LGNLSEKKLSTAGPIIISISLIGALFFRFFDLDEGWNMFIIKKYLDTGRFSLGLALADPELTFSKPWYWFMSFFHNGSTESGGSYLLYRLPGLLMSFASLFLLHDLLKKISNNAEHSYYRLISLSFMSIWFIIGQGVSIRPEAFYTFAIMLAIYAGYLYSTGKVNLLLLSILLSGVSFSIHPNGIFAIFINIYTVIYYWSETKGSNTYKLVCFFFISAIISATLILWNLSLSDWVNAFAVISQDPGHSKSIWQEYIRYKSLLLNYFPFSIIILLITMTSLIYKAEGFAKYLKILLISGILYLILQPTKWAYYYAILIPILSVLTSYNLDRFDKHSWARGCFSSPVFLILVHVLVMASSLMYLNNEAILSNLRADGNSGGRYNRLIAMREIIANKKTLMRFQLYPYFNQVQMISLDSKDKPEYVIWNMLNTKEQLEKRYNLTLKYNEVFKFQDRVYILYSVL
jgi:hypothetical protein